MKKNRFEGLKIVSPINSNESDGMDVLFRKWTLLGIFDLIDNDIKQSHAETEYAYSLNHTHVYSGFTDDYDTAVLSNILTSKELSDEQRIEAQIWIGLLTSPVELRYPSHAEVEAVVRVRLTTTRIARLTLVDFHTSSVNRPISHWTFDENFGFCLNSDVSLTEALCLALMPPTAKAKYSFSCQRATEYILLLAIASEIKDRNPILYAKLENQWRKKPIYGEKFQSTFLKEIGSTDRPLPKLWLIPGDRIWFKNPDNRSSDVMGYEGSWVIYLGDGKFSNFWQFNKPYSLEDKCIEIFCWRYGLEKDSNGIYFINEQRVNELKKIFMSNTHLKSRIMESMMAYRDPHQVYEKGGAMDTTREHLKLLSLEFSDIFLS